MILGDDIVIRDCNLAREYKSIMSDLGVGISPEKTHISSNMFEFAKRWYRNGVEISGIPFKGFLGIKQFWWRAIPEVQNALNRVGLSDSLPDPGDFSELFKL